jgi:transposase InsO family protein
MAESFWSSLKRELVRRYRFPDRASARRAIFAWINTYDHRRLHSSLGYIPPALTSSREVIRRSRGGRNDRGSGREVAVVLCVLG